MSAHCLFCGGAIAANRACDVCGTRRRAVDEKRIGAPCPRCAGVHLGPVEIGAVVVQGCPACGGLFVAASEWDAILEHTATAPLPELVPLGAVAEAAAARAQELEAQPYRSALSPGAGPRPSVVPMPIDLARDVACPVCRVKADRVEFGGISAVFVDVCSLHGIWLDGGELAKVVKHARENPVFLDPGGRSVGDDGRRDLLEYEGVRDPNLAHFVLRAIVRAFRS